MSSQVKSCQIKSSRVKSSPVKMDVFLACCHARSAGRGTSVVNPPEMHRLHGNLRGLNLHSISESSSLKIFRWEASLSSGGHANQVEVMPIKRRSCQSSGGHANQVVGMICAELDAPGSERPLAAGGGAGALAAPPRGRQACQSASGCGVMVFSESTNVHSHRPIPASMHPKRASSGHTARGGAGGGSLRSCSGRSSAHRTAPFW